MAPVTRTNRWSDGMWSSVRYLHCFGANCDVDCAFPCGMMLTPAASCLWRVSLLHTVAGTGVALHHTAGNSTRVERAVGGQVGQGRGRGRCDRGGWPHRACGLRSSVTTASSASAAFRPLLGRRNSDERFVEAGARQQRLKCSRRATRAGFVTRSRLSPSTSPPARRSGPRAGAGHHGSGHLPDGRDGQPSNHGARGRGGDPFGSSEVLVTAQPGAAERMWARHSHRSGSGADLPEPGQMLQELLRAVGESGVVNAVPDEGQSATALNPEHGG